MLTPTYMITVDQHGKQLGPGEWIPGPEHIAADGLAALPGYLERFFASAAAFRSLSVFTADQRSGFALCRRAGEPAAELCFAVDRHTQPEQEFALREFFAARGMAPSRDYLARNGGVAEAVRVLQFPLSGSTETVAQLCSDLLRAGFSVAEPDALDFRFEQNA